jgi:hypothetical protein
MASRFATAHLIAVALAAALPPLALAQQPKPTVDTSRGLTILYADGRVSTRPLRLIGGMWTPYFPRVDGVETSRNGLPLTTLDVKHVVDGDNITVTVSLFYGGVNKNPVEVAKVRLSPGTPVVVNELRSYGVEPITLSISAIPPTTAYVPEGVSPSGQVDVRAEPIGPNVSAYRVVVTNRSSLALVWFAVKAHRNSGGPITSRPRGKRNVPLIGARSEYAFELSSATSGSSAAIGAEMWQPIDRIEITSLMWEDGLVEGDLETAEQQRRFDMSKAAYLRAVLSLLRNGPRSLANLRAQFAQVGTVDIETQQARDSVLADLVSLERTEQSPSGRAFSVWLKTTTDDYQQWLARVVLPKPRQ